MACGGVKSAIAYSRGVQIYEQSHKKNIINVLNAIARGGFETNYISCESKQCLFSVHDVKFHDILKMTWESYVIPFFFFLENQEF